MARHRRPRFKIKGAVRRADSLPLLQPVRGWRAVVLVFAILVVPLGVGVAFTTWADYRTDTALRERGVVTDGVARKVDQYRFTWYAVVEFTTRDGKTRSVKINDEWWGPRWSESRPRKGDVVVVRYDPARPRSRVADASKPLGTGNYTITMIVSGSLSGVAAVGGALSLRGHRRPR